MKSQLLDNKKIEAEAAKQSEYFNSVFGLVCFTLALTCSGMDNPQKAANVCLLMVIPMLHHGYKYFPPEVRAIRDLAKETRDPHVIELVKHLDKKLYGFRSMFTRNLMFWSGLMFYCAVLSVPNFSIWLRT